MSTIGILENAILVLEATVPANRWVGNSRKRACNSPPKRSSQSYFPSKKHKHKNIVGIIDQMQHPPGALSMLAAVVCAVSTNVKLFETRQAGGLTFLVTAVTVTLAVLPCLSETALDQSQRDSYIYHPKKRRRLEYNTKSSYICHNLFLSKYMCVKIIHLPPLVRHLPIQHHTNEQHSLQ